MTEKTESPAGFDAAPAAATEAPAKRGRGRPKKTETPPQGAAPAGFDGAADPAQETGTSGPSKRGRKSKAKGVDPSALASQLQGIHHMVAMVTGLPELVINETEAALLAQGLSAVCDEYDLNLSGKSGAMIQLLGAAAMVYAPRALVIREKIRVAKAKTVNPDAEAPAT